MKTLRQIRNEHVLQVLNQTNWDLKKASEMLKVSEGFLKKEIRKIGQSKAPQHTVKTNK
ncbi:MAG: hypothetical protein KBB65_07020 [Syntrophorhabdaceae bacterium]|nr:hypothetical protein [Syntrophorhabdaceae bacterium]